MLLRRCPGVLVQTGSLKVADAAALFDSRQVVEILAADLTENRVVARHKPFSFAEALSKR